MRLIILPPKRFEDPADPKYDPIRWKPWYSALNAARNKLPMLALANSIYEKNSHLAAKAAAEECLVGSRDLWNYRAFKAGKTKLTELNRKVFQRVLDESYLAYCEDNANKSLTTYIARVSKLYGLNPRHVTEVWETDPTFYPIGYK